VAEGEAARAPPDHLRRVPADIGLQRAAFAGTSRLRAPASLPRLIHPCRRCFCSASETLSSGPLPLTPCEPAPPTSTPPSRRHARCLPPSFLAPPRKAWTISPEPYPHPTFPTSKARRPSRRLCLHGLWHSRAVAGRAEGGACRWAPTHTPRSTPSWRRASALRPCAPTAKPTPSRCGPPTRPSASPHPRPRARRNYGGRRGRVFLSRICSARGCNVPPCLASPRPIPRAVLTNAPRHARRGTALARLLRDGPLRAPGGTPRGSSRARRTWRASTPSSSTGPMSRPPRRRAGRGQRRRSRRCSAQVGREIERRDRRRQRQTKTNGDEQRQIERDGEKETERKRQRDRQKEAERQSDRERQRATESDRETR
jgi:hypothetical protein